VFAEEGLDADVSGAAVLGDEAGLAGEGIDDGGGELLERAGIDRDTPCVAPGGGQAGGEQ
jgi:hypothetical protein